MSTFTSCDSSCLNDHLEKLDAFTTSTNYSSVDLKRFHIDASARICDTLNFLLCAMKYSLQPDKHRPCRMN